MTFRQASLKVPAASAEALAGLLEDAFSVDPAPPVVTLFEGAKESDPWQVALLFEEEIDRRRLDGVVARAQRSLGLPPHALLVETLAERDWVSESQKLRAPVIAGRIFLYGAHDRHRRRPFGIALEIEAGQAFGTGQHATTAGCLLLLDRLAKRLQPRRMLDLGCGSGVLALAMAKLWGRPVLASDIDPVAVRVAAETVRRNRLRPGRDVRTVAAIGLAHPAIRKAAPFDLVAANILAAPLVGMAGAVAHATAPGGHLILAGLLRRQEARVVAAYRDRGFIRVDRHVEGDWPTLVLRRV